MAAPLDPADWPVLHFRAMGCQMSARLAADPATAEKPLRQVGELFARLERCLSRFDPDSELSRLNRQAGAWVIVSPQLWEVVDAALALAAETGGIFDPTLLDALERAGYDRSFERLDPTGPMLPVGGEPGRFHEVARGPGRRLRLPPGVRLDLGGIAKGYAAQKAVEQLRPWGGCLVDAGGDLAAGAAPPGWPGWPVGIAAPSGRAGAPDETDDNLLTIWLAEGAVATSGVDYRRWVRGGRSLHHVIDPRTGAPAATDLLTVTVVDRSAMRAEAWATAALVQGTTAAPALARRGLAALLMDGTGGVQVTPPLLPAVAWPPAANLDPAWLVKESRD